MSHSSGNPPHTAILHYTAPPVVGGVEAVMAAHARLFISAGFPTSLIVGRGEAGALPPETGLLLVPEMDTQHPEVLAISQVLEQGQVPPEFEILKEKLVEILQPLLEPFDNLILHNVLTKHFNLPLTAAVFQLIDDLPAKHWIAWCHDFTWTSPNSRGRVHPGYPWDLLRTYHPGVSYVVVSEKRQQELVGLFGVDVDKVEVIYNGVDPETLLGLSEAGIGLVQRMGLLSSDLVLLMPVRVTQAKNVEYAMHVLAALKELGLCPKLVVTGPPDPHAEHSQAYFDSLQDLRLRLGIENEVHFVYEFGPDPTQGLFIDERVVADFYRTADLMFMPSHREGFGIPVLEAALVGLPVASAGVPAAREVGGQDVLPIDLEASPEQTASQINAWAQKNPQHRLRVRVRQQYTWQAIFQQQIQPLLQKGGGV